MNQKLVEKIQNNLSPDLLHKKFRNGNHPLSGHCYVSSEVFFVLMGGKEAGYKSFFIRHEGQPHWFIKNATGKVIDITADQFSTKIDYTKGIGKGFLTKLPSKRAQVLMERVCDGNFSLSRIKYKLY
jgi:hypothetical protein